ncbi:MAG TPA: DEAD/DEAH box helicase, partial [bacterium]|nr:DEAD/DEAH box helicase [bacterium]
MPDTPPTFQDLGLSADALAAIAKKGFEEPSPIQQLVIPKLLRNSTDIIAQAQTGTGKTAAFGLPLIEMLNPREFSVQALVLTPTRELAIQVSDEIRSLRSDSRLQVIPVYGGQSFNQQLRSLKKGAHIVVGTPGRVIDHLHRRTLRLEDIEFLVLDEADEMLNMGFIEDMEEIIKHTNPDKRTLLFSATMPPRIKELAKKYLKEQEFITVKQQPLTPRQTEHIYYEVKNAEKFEALCRIIDIEDEFYGLVFCRTKSDVDTVVSQLIERGYDADAI